jgi:hypothetical protein
VDPQKSAYGDLVIRYDYETEVVVLPPGRAVILTSQVPSIPRFALSRRTRGPRFRAQAFILELFPGCRQFDGSRELQYAVCDPQPFNVSNQSTLQ